MRIAYFDCIAGISGDMALGALIDAGADRDEVRTALEALRVEPFGLEFEEVESRGVRATRARTPASARSSTRPTWTPPFATPPSGSSGAWPKPRLGSTGRRSTW
jgi:hypothetical protein